jgi:hypothetical protein
MRNILFAAIAAGSPLAARASLIHEDFLTVHYEGVVASISTYDHGDGGCLCGYMRGDKIAGTLLVDLDNAPRDNVSDPRFGQYGYGFLNQNGPSFVNGHAPARLESQDRLQIRDQYEPGYDFFDILDHESGVSRDGSGRFVAKVDSLFLLANSLTVDFIHGDGLLQDFVLQGRDAAEAHAQGFMNVQRRWLDHPDKLFGGTIGFLVTKLSVKPGRCSI